LNPGSVLPKLIGISFTLMGFDCLPGGSSVTTPVLDVKLIPTALPNLSRIEPSGGPTLSDGSSANA